MSTRRRHRLGIDEERYRKAMDEIARLVREGDTSDTSWQDDLPEAPDLTVKGATIALVIPRGSGGPKPARRQQAMSDHKPHRTKAVRGRVRRGRGRADRPGSDGDGSR